MVISSFFFAGFAALLVSFYGLSIRHSIQPSYLNFSNIVANQTKFSIDVSINRMNAGLALTGGEL